MYAHVFNTEMCVCVCIVYYWYVEKQRKYLFKIFFRLAMLVNELGWVNSNLIALPNSENGQDLLELKTPRNFASSSEEIWVAP